MNTTQIIQEIIGASSLEELELLRLKYLGRSGEVTLALRELSKLPIEERKAAGATLNNARSEIQQALLDSEKVLQRKSLVASSSQSIDVTMPAPGSSIGHDHPVTQVMDELIRIFWQMGYSVADGPEIENEWYNFEALNIGKDHPARDMQDSFYLEGGNLPRTHTSGVQVRYMESHKPPIRIIAPGKVYRNEDEDARHVWMFHQIEGLVVDKGISLGDLKGTLLSMMRGLLGSSTEIRLRPSFFPYTEPSVELDATCVICAGKGCGMCSGTGWLELGGAGMVHPQVLKNVNIDPMIYSGFAFGFGPERVAAIKFGVPDVREFWRPNLKFLEQF